MTAFAPTDVILSRQWVLDCGTRYWPSGRDPIDALPIPAVDAHPGAHPVLRHVALPEWAADLGVDGRLLVFACVLEPGNAPAWQRCDWIANAFHMLTGSSERAHELVHGPVLSYAFRLPRTLDPLHQRAWANRIFLFLRRWAAQEAGLPEEAIFGPLPRPEIHLTHDVDAISLTPEIRFKQTVFQMAIAARALTQREPSRAVARIGDAARYAFSSGDFRTFSRVREMERAAGVRSTLHFYGGPSGLKRISPRRILIDPAYDIGSEMMRAELGAFAEGGWTVGLHQSFGAWDDADKMVSEKLHVESALQAPVNQCRQHWLRFSWASTWAAQVAAGLNRDSTLGFNDRAGFRGGHALTIKPWDMASARPLEIETIPMVFMDSHFYDYASGDIADPEIAMRAWLNEVRAVHGEVTVNWHTHTITDVYDWGAGYETLLGLLS